MSIPSPVWTSASAVSRHRDIIIAGVLAIVLTAEVAMWDFTDPVTVVPAALLATLPLALRRRSPLVAFVLSGVGFSAVIVLSGNQETTVGLIAVYAVTLFSVGRYTRRLEAWISGVLVLVAAVAFLFIDPEKPTLGGLAFSVAFIGGPWLAGLVVRLRVDREAALQRRNRDLLQEQAEHARAAVAAERARIARELHDVVSHAISVTVLQARGGRRLLGIDDGEVRRAFDAIEHVNAQALGDMRRLLFLLREADAAPETQPSPSLALLDSLIDQVRDAGLPVELSMTGSIERVPPGVDSSAFRIVQEALTNASSMPVRPHAPGWRWIAATRA